MDKTRTFFEDAAADFDVESPREEMTAGRQRRSHDAGVQAKKPYSDPNDKKHDATDDKNQKDGKAFMADLQSRASVLVSLMVVQSLSGMILSNFEELIKEHVVVTLFLTMLVGAGGNAGNQATVSLIQRLAREQDGHMKPSKEFSILLREARLGLLLGLLLCSVAFLRVLLSKGNLVSAIAIGLAAFFIVFISVIVGAALPLGFVHIGIDAAHAGPAIQVLMDIIGVFLTCVICSGIFRLAGVNVPLSSGVLHAEY